MKVNNRKSIRLKVFDYTTPWWYYVTICTYEHKYYFGNVNESMMVLNNAGKIAEDCWVKIPEHFYNVELDYYVFMPNHLHGIIIINKQEEVAAQYIEPLEKERRYQNIVKGSLGSIIRSYKAAVTRECLRCKITDFKWQRNYYERIIRNEKELYNIIRYIEQNPLKWEYEKNINENLF